MEVSVCEHFFYLFFMHNELHTYAITNRVCLFRFRKLFGWKTQNLCFFLLLFKWIYYSISFCTIAGYSTGFSFVFTVITNTNSNMK